MWHRRDDLHFFHLNLTKWQVRLILNKKKGFVKLALRCGVSLVPTFSFGEAAIYDKVGDSWRVKFF